MEFRKWFEERISLINKLYLKLEKDYDIEIMHQYRVNLRKLYAFNEVYAVYVDKRYSKKLFKLIKNILKPTSTLRDIDLFLIEVKQLECSDEVKNRLYTVLNSLREEIFAEYLSTLRSMKYENRLNSLKLTTQESELFLFNIEILDNKKIIKDLEKKTYHKFNKVDIKTSSKKFHNLRKKFKKFRYALDIYELCFKNDMEVIDDIQKLKELQNLFGAIQDNYVRLEFIKNHKNQFSKAEFLELEDYFKLKLKDAKQKLFKS